MRPVFRFVLLFSLPFLFSSPAPAEEKDYSIEDLYFLVGEWQGRTTLHFPDQPDRGPTDEDITLNCQKVFLGATMVRCQALLVREGGKKREWIASFNYHSEEKRFYVLYQYGTYPGIARFPFTLSNGGLSLAGFVTASKPEGEVPVEKINWEFSADKTKIIAHEFYDVTEDGIVNWQLGFDFEIEKK